MKMIVTVVKGIWYYFWGHVFAWFLYDSMYIRGRWFAGKLNGLCSVGWQWVTHDAVSSLFSLNNKGAKFPISQQCRVINPQNIFFDPDDLNNFQSYGIYYQALGKIVIGKGTYIGPNVGLITSNHDLTNPDQHLEPKAIILGEKCWIGINSVILPGVELGAGTVVGAGSVVTKSFPEGRCVIAGSPAKIIRKMERSK